MKDTNIYLGEIKFKYQKFEKDSDSKIHLNSIRLV